MNKSFFDRLFQTKLTRKEFLKFSGLMFAGLFGLYGVISEIISHAATPYASAEAEDGTLAGGATLADGTVTFEAAGLGIYASTYGTNYS
jgi:hypothetical protein